MSILEWSEFPQDMPDMVPTGSPGQQQRGGDLQVGQAPAHALGDLGLGQCEADPATTHLPGGFILAYFDHEWHRHDSELLSAKPDHEATMAVPHPFRKPAIAPERANMCCSLPLVPPPHRAVDD